MHEPCPSDCRGRRECRTLGASAAACAVVEGTRVSHHGCAGHVRHSPRNGFNGFLRALPSDRACLPLSPAEKSADLTPASGRQDHTTSPSAASAHVQRAAASTASRANVRDDRDTPLSRARDGGGYRSDLGTARTGIFLLKGLDTGSASRPVGQITPSPLPCKSRPQ
jgi:hypothetical protein